MTTIDDSAADGPSLAAALQGLERLDAAGRRAACIGYVQQARQEMKQGFVRGDAAAALLRGFTETFDRLISALYRAAHIPFSTMVSLVALGGYGRGELFPFSDLDLLVLYDGGEDELSTRLVEHVIYPLWDAKVSVGYAVRGIEETLKLAAQDLTVRTALLDGRSLAGNEGMYHALVAGGLREFFGPSGTDFLGALREERAVRHRKFGETIYRLEPNIKLGKGGLRDLTTGLWAAKAALGVVDLSQLAPGGATTRQVRALLEAEEFLRRVRLAMHVHAGRPQDHLLFELQEALGPKLFPEEEVFGVKRRTSAVEPAVERLMHAYYRHARTVVLETERLLKRCGQTAQVASDEGAPVSARPDEHLRLVGGSLHSQAPNRFWEEPAELVRAFQAALAADVPLDSPTRDVIAEAAAGEPGAQLVADATAAASWLELLADPERHGEETILEEMHDLGVVSALVPEFAACTGRIQHDLYHVYTVDVHSLYVVALLKAWRRGSLGDRFPTPVAVMAAVEQPRSLMLAALLHDVGKPLGHGHAVKGARLAAGVAARLGMSAAEQEEVRFLVEHHIVMAHLSQRRDLSDPKVTVTMAELARTVDNLRRLYLLTVADTAKTSPDNLTEWKASLLDELYLKTYLQLGHGEGVAAADRERRLRDQRGALELQLRREVGEAQQLADRAPQEMLLAFLLDDLVHHLQVALSLEADRANALRLSTRLRRDSTTEVTVCCWDAPGRLAMITGVMLAHRVEVLAAQVFTLDPPTSRGGPATVLDVFTVRAPDEDVWGDFNADLERALRGELSVPELVQRRVQPSGLPPKHVPRVESTVTVDNDISERATVIDVQAPDRLGVLHAITRALSEQDLAIQLSKVATEAGRVVDIFYVSDGRGGGKVTDGERLQGVREAVLAAIAALGRPASGS
jgi:[protein-PII] uridylyltransferase